MDTPPVIIYLNTEPSNFDIAIDIGTQHENSNSRHVEYLVPDLNLNPSLPYFEDDTDVQVGLQTYIGPDNHTADENISDENENGDGDVNANEELSETSSQVNGLRTLSNGENQAIYNMLQQRSFNGKLKQGVTRMVASQFSVSMRTVQRIWKQSEYGGMHANVSHRKTRNCGRKKVQINLEHIREIPLHQRTTLCSLSCSLNVKKTTLFRRLKSGGIRRHSNAIKPFLKEENKRARLQFCLSMLDRDSMPHDPTFVGMYNIFHIDEKWFYMTKKSENYYLLPDEDDPLRTCKSKNFIGKVMFLVAIARPRFDAQGNELFSGKIGVFPFVTHEPAKRTSINRVAGTMETKPISLVEREVIRSYLIEKVIPCIKEIWPIDDSRGPIFIQQDNGRTHTAHNDDQFCRATAQGGFDIRLMSQPPNSLDLNVLDIGFFSAIQSLQHKEPVKAVDELVSVVERSFQAFEVKKSNRIFLTLQACMVEIMGAKGCNKYKIPHVKKAMLERAGQLPIRLKCGPELVQEVLGYLSN